MAELFGVDVRTVSDHLCNVYASGELNEEATLRKIRTVRAEGSREVARNIVFYNLDAIISVGYRLLANAGTVSAEVQAEGAAVTNTLRHSEGALETVFGAHLLRNGCMPAARDSTIVLPKGRRDSLVAAAVTGDVGQFPA